PGFRSGRGDDAVWQVVAALASRRARARVVVLSGTPRRAPAPVPLPGCIVLLVILAFVALFLYQASTGPARFPRGGFYPAGPFGGFGGGFGGGGGGFGGFGGGSFGGGGAGRSW